MKRVLVVDDHPVFRGGLIHLLNKEPSLTVIGEASNHREAMRTLRGTSLDLCLVDLSLGTSNGLSLVKNISSEWPDVGVLVISMHDELLYAERAYRAGADGYVMKDKPWSTLLLCIQQVLNGQLAFSKSVGRLLFTSSKNESRGLALSDRELEVFELLGSGSRVKEIAALLFVSPKTIESHIASIKRKLDIKHASALVHRATLWHVSKQNQAS